MQWNYYCLYLWVYVRLCRVVLGYWESNTKGEGCKWMHLLGSILLISLLLVCFADRESVEKRLYTLYNQGYVNIQDNSWFWRQLLGNVGKLFRSADQVAIHHWLVSWWNTRWQKCCTVAALGIVGTNCVINSVLPPGDQCWSQFNKVPPGDDW